MYATSVLREDEKTFMEAISLYIEELQKQIEHDPKAAKREAREALIRTGVLTSKGKNKDVIVSWE